MLYLPLPGNACGNDSAGMLHKQCEEAPEEDICTEGRTPGRKDEERNSIIKRR